MVWTNVESRNKIYYNFVIDIWISSSVRPLVSGTRNAANATAAAQMTQNIENVPARVASTDLYKQQIESKRKKEDWEVGKV